jgi:hypothetical protein
MELVAVYKFPAIVYTLKNNKLNCLQKLSDRYKYYVWLYASLHFIDALCHNLSPIMMQNKEEEVAK